ncbi:MAG: serine/threonine-protein kinase [Planctomycetota bacterium]
MEVRWTSSLHMRTDPRSPACRVNDAEWSFASEVLEGPPTPDSSTPGEVLKQVGPFTVEAELGRGGMGQVYQVRYGGRRYALKLVLKDTELVRSRMAREARLVGALQHPGIVRLHGAGVVAGFSFLLYERVVDGRPLDSRELPLPARVERIAQVADAVGFAHEHGIVHRDLKPENVLVDRDGGVRVIDFGLATHASLDRLTQTGAFLGTPSYMAPEQFSTDPALQTPAVDVWALGVMLYEALTGELPFRAQTALELLAALNVTSAPAPSARNRAVSPALDRVCARALSRRQEDRPPDGVAFARALREALREAPARRVSPAWIVALGGAACAVGAAAVWAWPGRATEPPAPVVEAPDLTDPFLLLRSEGWDGPRLLLEARARLRVDPGDVQALGAEAAALQEVDDYAGSVAVAESVLRQDAGDLVALRALAGSLYRLERLDEAYDACERALAVDPRADFALIYGSMIELGRGESARGLELAQRAVALQPQSGEALAAHELPTSLRSGS